MPPKFKFTKDEITKAALNITKESGASSLTARALAARLGCSVKPIFGLFKNMEEVQQEVLKSANDLYQSYLAEDMKNGKYPPYKARGMAYIRFAKEEKELFKLLFMRGRTHENIENDKEELRPLLKSVQQKLGLNEESAYLFHLEMWIYVHGIATMLATSYLEWDEEFISRVVTDGYEGLKNRYGKGK
ncbi:MAG: WHG domain-containing protein [Lachnospiraceae bacterium]|nr:WHG domain-containing protein [Lachnospiraceae bacterium]MDE6982244.1 WHG domain-containing protein [Lachnospiraceae bacterium]